MMADYYEVLKISRSADDYDIKNAYRGLSMKFHPDKNQADDASKTYSDISEAYDVLSSKHYRAIYDQLGVQGIKAKRFEGRSAEIIFEEFFGTKNPFATIDYKKLLEDEKRVVLPDAIYNLDCSISELYNGCVKNFEISRNVVASKKGDPIEYKAETKILSIVVKSGWKIGTKVVFPKEGDQHVNAVAPANIVFVIALVKSVDNNNNNNNNNNNCQWSISDTDLIYKHKLSLFEALNGGIISITTLDGRVLTVACPEVVNPSYEKRITGEGMPLWKTPTIKGDLIIQFDITFPTYLSLANHKKLKEILK